MKKIVLTAIITALISTTAWAKPGETAGYIYPTDIRTDFYGRKINSYNIGGQTVILGEDLGYFGFDIIWNPQDRTLEINDRYNNPQDTGYKRDISLYILPEGYYSHKAPDRIYETDIKTFLNGKEIKGYNVGGQTAIVCEDLRNYGYSVEWNAENRTVSVEGNGEYNEVESDIGNVIVTGRLNAELAKTTKEVSILLKNGEKLRGLYASDFNTHYVSLADFLKASGSEWSFDGETITIKPSTGDVQLSDDPWLYDNGEETEKKVDKIYLEILCGDSRIDVSYEKGGSLLTNGQTYEKSADAYIYDSAVYIPWYTAMKIYNCK